MLTFCSHSRQPGMSGQNREISRILGPVFPTCRPERTGGAKTSESRKKATLTLKRMEMKIESGLENKGAV